MPKNDRGSYDEGASLLFPEGRGGKVAGGRFREEDARFLSPTIKGVASQLRNWPSNLFVAFLAACLIIGSLIFLILVTLAVCLPITTTKADRCRDSTKRANFGNPINVYLVKLGHRSWSPVEYCSVEIAVRRNPSLQFRLINLSRENDGQAAGRRNASQGVRERKTEQKEAGRPSLNRTSKESGLGEKLAASYENVRSTDLSIEELFERSKLSEIAGRLDDGTLETAAKAELLWNAPGIALNPDSYCSLRFLERFADRDAAVEPTRDIQVAGVACQAFFGFLIDEIWKNGLNDQTGPWNDVERALRKYCDPSRYRCPGITMFRFDTECPLARTVDCPIAASSMNIDQPRPTNARPA